MFADSYYDDKNQEQVKPTNSWLTPEFKTKCLNILLTPWILSAMVGTSSTIFISLLSLSNTPTVATPINNEQQNLAVSNNHWANTRYQVFEEMTRDDYNSMQNLPVENPGLEQKTVLTAGTMLDYRLLQQQNDKKSPNHLKLKEEILENIRADVLRMLVYASSGGEAILTYQDPEKGKSEIRLDAPTLLAIAQLRLRIIDAAENKHPHSFSLTDITKDVINGQKELRQAKINLLAAKGYEELAAKMSSFDILGRQLDLLSPNPIPEAAPPEPKGRP